MSSDISNPAISVSDVTPIGLVLALLLLVANLSAASPDELNSGRPRAFPRVNIGSGRQLQYVGTFSADGTFKPLTKFGLFLDSLASKSSATASNTPAPPPGPRKFEEEEIARQVPPNIAIKRNERVVEDFVPPEHAVKIAKGHSILGEFRDSIVSFAYGSEMVLKSPQSITTDSQQRILVTDTVARSVHVFTYYPRNSFEIQGGPERRLQAPSGIAVDGDDNIYVSDSERGSVLVYDPEGRFVRTLGSSGEEGLFEHPTSIAIDSKAGHLYVIDTARHALFILDLEGNVISRVGAGSETGFSSRSGSTEPGRFNAPKAVLIHGDEVIVLDSPRIHIMDRKGKFLSEFTISGEAQQQADISPGLFMDAENRIYISDPASGTIQVYDHQGKFLQSFGRIGGKMGEFNTPTGMWADSAGRVYIVDANNRRIQIYQFSASKPK